MGLNTWLEDHKLVQRCIVLSVGFCCFAIIFVFHLVWLFYGFLLYHNPRAAACQRSVKSFKYLLMVIAITFEFQSCCQYFATRKRSQIQYGEKPLDGPQYQ